MLYALCALHDLEEKTMPRLTHFDKKGRAKMVETAGMGESGGGKMGGEKK